MNPADISESAWLGFWRRLTSVCGNDQGILQARQAAIVDALETRFGVVSPDIRQKVQVLRDEDILRNGLRAAVSSASLEDFVRSIGT